MSESMIRLTMNKVMEIRDNLIELQNEACKIASMKEEKDRKWFKKFQEEVAAAFDNLFLTLFNMGAECVYSSFGNRDILYADYKRKYSANIPTKNDGEFFEGDLLFKYHFYEDCEEVLRKLHMMRMNVSPRIYFVDNRLNNTINELNKIIDLKSETDEVLINTSMIEYALSVEDPEKLCVSQVSEEFMASRHSNSYHYSRTNITFNGSIRSKFIGPIKLKTNFNYKINDRSFGFGDKHWKLIKSYNPKTEMWGGEHLIHEKHEQRVLEMFGDKLQHEESFKDILMIRYEILKVPGIVMRKMKEAGYHNRSFEYMSHTDSLKKEYMELIGKMSDAE